MNRFLALAALVFCQAAFAATPSEGVPVVIRRGFFAETDLGLFMAFGGNDIYSDAQSYFQLGVGYDIRIGKHGSLPIGAHFGIGANSGNCYSGRTTGGDCSTTDNFTMSFISGSVGYLHEVVSRFFIGGKLMGGYTLLDPAPVKDASGNPVRGAGHFGAAFSLEYATRLDHLTIGLDLVYRFMFGPNIHSIQAFPRIKYTF